MHQQACVVNLKKIPLSTAALILNQRVIILLRSYRWKKQSRLSACNVGGTFKPFFKFFQFSLN
jgi:hypothetical protein